MYIFVLIVCYVVSPIDCYEVPVRNRVEWCAKIDEARKQGELWNAFVLRVDKYGSRESWDRGCDR